MERSSLPISRSSASAAGRPAARDLVRRETFLASLALALALVELHSRSGARLGALFLDEGFGSLDSDALASSLAVLQAETGGYKLVAVISHPHAVAEAVEDVMWVERRPEGSSARWLDAVPLGNSVSCCELGFAAGSVARLGASRGSIKSPLLCSLFQRC